MVESNVFIGTIDSPEEVQKMYDVLGENVSKCKAIIRIHVDDSHSIIPLGSKFGCMLYEVEGIMEVCKKYQRIIIRSNIKSLTLSEIFFNN